MQDARRAAAAERLGIVAVRIAAAAALDAELLHVGIVAEIIDRTDGVAPAADAGNEVVGFRVEFLLCLCADLLTDDLLEIAHHHRIGMRTNGGANDIVGIRDVRRPVADSLTRRILQRSRTARYGDDRRAEQTHTEHVELLTLYVQRPHEDAAFHPKECRHRRRRDTVLSCTRLCDDALLAHAVCEECLSERIVDLMRPRMEKILALEIDVRLAVVLRQPLGKVKIRRTPCILLEIAAVLRLKRRIVTVFQICLLQLIQCRHHDLGHILPAIVAKSSLLAHILLLLRPNINQFSCKRPDIRRTHQSLSDQHAFTPCRTDTLRIRTGKDAALADERTVLIRIGQEGKRRLDACLKGHEIAVIDADEFCRRSLCNLQITAVVYLHEGIHPETPRQVKQLFQLLRREDTHNQQDSIRVQRTRLVDLIRVDDKILAQKRCIHARTHSRKVRVAAEKMRIGVHREHGRTCCRIDIGEFRDRVRRRQPSLGGRLQLALGDQAPAMPSEVLRHTERPTGQIPFQYIERHGLLCRRNNAALLRHNFSKYIAHCAPPSNDSFCAFRRICLS